MLSQLIGKFFVAILLCIATVVTCVFLINAGLAILAGNSLEVDISSIETALRTSRTAAADIIQAEKLFVYANLAAAIFLLARVLVPTTISATSQLKEEILRRFRVDEDLEVPAVGGAWKAKVAQDLFSNSFGTQSADSSESERFFIGKGLPNLPPSIRVVASLGSRETRLLYSLVSLAIAVITVLAMIWTIIALSNLDGGLLADWLLNIAPQMLIFILIGVVVISFSTLSNSLFSRKILRATSSAFGQTQKISDQRIGVVASPSNLGNHLIGQLTNAGGLGSHRFFPGLRDNESTSLQGTGSFETGLGLESQISETKHPLEDVAASQMRTGWILLVLGSVLALSAAIMPLLIGISGVSLRDLISPVLSVILVVIASQLARIILGLGNEFVRRAELVANGVFSRSLFTIAELFGETSTLGSGPNDQTVGREATEQGCRIGYRVHSAEVDFFAPEGTAEKEPLSIRHSQNSESAANSMVAAIEGLRFLDGPAGVQPNFKRLDPSVLEPAKDPEAIEGGQIEEGGNQDGGGPP